MKKEYGAWAEPPAEILPKDCGEQAKTEVLVVGAGIAGMSCALRAAERGAKVTVMELGGGYSARGFNIGVVNSAYMASRGIYNDVDEVAREWIKRCGNRCDERIVRLFCEKSPEAMDWLLELLTRPEYGVRPELNGCVYKGETYKELYGTHIFYDGPVSRQGRFGGMNDVLESMYREMNKLGVTFMFKTRMRQLTKEHGRVTGAVAERQEGGLVCVRADRGVVLATGDIGGNEEMCRELAPMANSCAVKQHWRGGGSNGDGHRAALWAGGELEDGPFPLIMHPQAFRHAGFCFMSVAGNGRRYMNEDSYLQGRSLGIIKTGCKFCWSVFDSAWPEKVPATLPYGGGLYWGQDYPLGRAPEYSEDKEREKLDWGLKLGITVMADTPEALAEKMGVDIQGFAEAFRRYNEMCASGRDTEFGKRPELLIPIDKPPYIARKIGTALLAVVGGVRVNTKMQVLGPERNPVEGLYAIGNTAGGRYGLDYPMLIPGSSHGTALTFGFLLGNELSS